MGSRWLLFDRLKCVCVTAVSIFCGSKCRCVRPFVCLSVGSFLLRRCATCLQKHRLECQKSPRRVYRPPRPPECFPSSPRLRVTRQILLFSTHLSKSTKCLSSDSSPPPSPPRPPPTPPGLSPVLGILSLPLPHLRQDLPPLSPVAVCLSSFPPHRHKLPPTSRTNLSSRVKSIRSATSLEFRTPPLDPAALEAPVNRGTMPPLLPTTTVKTSPPTQGGTRKPDQKNHPRLPCTCSSTGFVSLIVSALLPQQLTSSQCSPFSGSLDLSSSVSPFVHLPTGNQLKPLKNAPSLLLTCAKLKRSGRGVVYLPSYPSPLPSLSSLLPSGPQRDSDPMLIRALTS